MTVVFVEYSARWRKDVWHGLEWLILAIECRLEMAMFNSIAIGGLVVWWCVGISLIVFGWQRRMLASLWCLDSTVKCYGVLNKSLWYEWEWTVSELALIVKVHLMVQSQRLLSLVTRLILPVVICSFRRLSHACLSISFYTTKLRIAH